MHRSRWKLKQNLHQGLRDIVRYLGNPDCLFSPLLSTSFPSPLPSYCRLNCGKSSGRTRIGEPIWSTPVPISQGEDHTEDHGSCRRRHYGRIVGSGPVRRKSNLVHRSLWKLKQRLRQSLRGIVRYLGNHISLLPSPLHVLPPVPFPRIGQSGIVDSIAERAQAEQA